MIEALNFSVRVASVLLMVNAVVVRASNPRSISLNGTALPSLGWAKTTDMSSQNVPLSAKPVTFK